MNKFKVGDRVECIVATDKTKVGDVGTVKGFCEPCAPHVGVEWDRNVGGHNGYENFDGKNGHCWFVDDSDIKIIGRLDQVTITTDNTKITATYTRDGKEDSISVDADKYTSFGRGAQAALGMVTGESMKKQDKPVFKAGEKVRVIGNTAHHDYNIGDIAILERFTAGRFWKTQKGCFYDVYERDIEPYVEQDKPEPVKLYCIESYDWRNSLTKGKVYEFDGHYVNYDNVESARFTDFADWKEHDISFSKRLVPLVKRPAKVGETVLYNNRLYKVVALDRTQPDEWVYIEDEEGCSNKQFCSNNVRCKCSFINIEKYFVLDGYKFEPEVCKCCGQIIKGEQS